VNNIKVNLSCIQVIEYTLLLNLQRLIYLPTLTYTNKVNKNYTFLEDQMSAANERLKYFLGALRKISNENYFA
jgi:hypothetical protein